MQPYDKNLRLSDFPTKTGFIICFKRQDAKF